MLFRSKKTVVPFVPVEDVSVVTIFNNPIKALPRKPVQIMTVAPVVITVPGPLPYESDKAVPWHYGADVYVLGVKQEFDTSTGVSNITGPAKVTHSGRLFSPDIAPPVIRRPLIITPASAPVSPSDQVSTPAAESSNTRGKGIDDEPARMEAPKTVNVEASQQEMEEILKIIKKSDFNVVEQLGYTPSKISMLSYIS